MQAVADPGICYGAPKGPLKYFYETEKVQITAREKNIIFLLGPCFRTF